MVSQREVGVRPAFRRLKHEAMKRGVVGRRARRGAGDGDHATDGVEEWK
jgi:hypothetical protein